MKYFREDDNVKLVLKMIPLHFLLLLMSCHSDGYAPGSSTSDTSLISITPIPEPTPTADYNGPVFGDSSPRPTCSGESINDVTLNWNAPAEMGTFSHYEIFGRPKNEGIFSFSEAWTADSNYLYLGKVESDTRSFNIKSLAQDTEYVFGVNTYAVFEEEIIRRAPELALATVECATAEELLPQDCPIGYIPVPRNIAVGVHYDFCVAKYEMKNVGGIATSQADLTPWVSIAQTDSIARCHELNAIDDSHGTYAVISNPEWMAIARNVEQVPENWSNNSPGVHPGVMARGHSDNNPTSALVANADDALGYVGTNGNSAAQAANSGWEQRRTLELSNGEIIWDFAGNVWEWVDWQVTPAKKAYRSTDGLPTSNFLDFKFLDRLIGENADDQMLPSTFMPVFTSLTRSNGLGGYLAGNNSSGGAVLRGGGKNGIADAGTFALYLGVSVNNAGTNFGFRCVLRP